ncbi:MAG: DUF3857 domain-containing protein [Candidatus Wallbacteria bacterium]|nr:DUF3857 domain-containing protein [Candidatus Wallbacteria bacterium]
MRKLFLFMLLLYAVVSMAEILSTKQGEEFSIENLKYADGRFSGAGKVIERDKVNKVYFAREEKNTETADIIPIDGKKESGDFVRPCPLAIEDPKSLMDEAATLEKKYPDVESIVVRDCGFQRLLPNGETSFIYHGAVKVLKESAISSNRQFYWGEDRDHVRIFLMRVISPDGSVNCATSDRITVSVPPDQGGAFISQGKIITVTLPKVTVGSIIEYIYENYTFNPFNREFFFPSFGFEDEIPVRLSRFEVVIPENRELYWMPRNMGDGGEPKTWTSPNGKHFCWEVRDSSPMIAEPSQPSYYDIAKCVKCSVLKDWTPYFDWERKMAEERMVLTPFLEEETRKIIAGCETKRDMVAAVYHWLQQNIRYISIKSGIGSGFSGHPAEMTFKNKMGDCIDKAILMATMLKACEVEAYPVWLKTKPGDTRDLRYPNWGTNHAINVVYLDGVRMTLDSTATTYRFPAYRSDDHGVWLDNPFKKEHYKSDVPTPSTNAYIRYQVFRIAEDESADIYYRTTYAGANEASARGYWMYRRQDMWEEELRQMITGDYPDSRLVRYKINNVFDLNKPFSRELFWEAPQVLEKSGKFRIMDFRNSISFPEAALESRKYPILRDSSFLSVYDYLVILPSHLRVKHLPENVTLSNPHSDFKAEARTTKNGFSYRISLAVKTDLVPVEDYAQYRKFTKQVEDCFAKVIFLESVKGE